MPGGPMAPMNGTGGPPARVLYVADPPTTDTRYRTALETADAITVTTVRAPEGVLDRVMAGVDALVCRHGGAVDAIDLLRRIRARTAALPVVIIGPDDGRFAGRAVAAGVSAYVERSDPDGPATVLARIRSATGDRPQARPDGASRMPIEDLAVQEELRLKERALDAAPIGITISDPDQPDNPLIYLNDAFERLTGYSKDETVGRNCRFLQGEESDEPAVRRMREAIDAAEPVSVELVNYRKDGETFWNRVDIAPIRDGDGTVTNYVGFQTDVTARKEAELEVERERAQLDHLLSRINGLIREVTTALVEAVTRDEVDRAVCARITDATIYDFCWIGEPDLSTDRIVPSAWAGSWDPDPDAIAVGIGDVADDDDGPVARAYRTSELQVVTDPAELSRIQEATSWMDGAAPAGLAAIPLVYRDTRYGVLTVYTSEPEALNERETVVLGALGRATATAINAIERGRILAADNVVELEFAVHDRDLFFVDLSAGGRPPIEYNGSVYREDGTTLMFFTTTAAPETVEAVVADHDEVRDVTLVSQSTEGNLFEFTVDPDSIITALAERGARTRGLTAENGVGSVSVELPTEADARAILELLRDRYAGIELTALQERERPPETKQEFIARVKNMLTERQLTALQTAYVSGYYEWKRPVSGDDLASSMDVARSTFHQHLRAAERKLIGEIFAR